MSWRHVSTCIYLVFKMEDVMQTQVGKSHVLSRCIIEKNNLKKIFAIKSLKDVWDFSNFSTTPLIPQGLLWATSGRVSHSSVLKSSSLSLNGWSAVARWAKLCGVWPLMIMASFEIKWIFKASFQILHKPGYRTHYENLRRSFGRKLMKRKNPEMSILPF